MASREPVSAGSVAPRNTVQLIRFTPAAFDAAVAAASGAGANASPASQTQFLAEHLRRLGAKSLLVESHYVDRHFIEEYALYYSRCLVQPRNVCTRIHAFSLELDQRSIENYLEEAATRGGANVTRIQDELTAAYLGFVVVRPLPSVPIGRTVLRPLPLAFGSRLATLRDYSVHLLGLELHVRGLAFQQQDRAVGACATAAIWVALQHLAHHDGGRAPTPAAITEAAVRHFLPEGRPFPSSGLTIEQVSEAFRSFQFGAELFRVADVGHFFRLLTIYLRSGIPVILAVECPEGERHAITALGYRVALTSGSRMSVAGTRYRGIQFLESNVSELIVHDDRLGPYVRARFVRRREGPFLALTWPNGYVEFVKIFLAFAPLYPKLRTDAEQLITRTGDIATVIQNLLGVRAGSLGADLFFDRAGSYLRSLYSMKLSPRRLARFQQAVALSRYVGVIRWSLNGHALIDTLWDTTDKMRNHKIAEQLVGAVALNREVQPHTDAFAKYFSTTAG